jgi:nuclear-control-of-ATPase protein 2
MVGLCVYYVYSTCPRAPRRFPNLTTLRQEIRAKRKALEDIRDESAQTLGTLVQLRPILLQSPTDAFLQELCTTLEFAPSMSPSALQTTLQILPSTHTHFLQSLHLLRPPWLVRRLPYLILLPPLAIYLYTSYPTLKPHLSHLLTSTTSTLKGFVTNWLIDPLSSILQTIRSGSSASSSLVHDETVRADLESLERMSISLLTAHPPPSLSPSGIPLTQDQLSALSSHILQTRDITPVLQVHTSILSPSSPSRQNPLLSLLLPPNTLLHTLLIQLQKAKVDLDFALQGISHLLKSQQLTFGFVGVAPALALVYLLWDAGSGLWRGTVGWGRWGGKNRRRRVWRGLRRVERILNASDAELGADADAGETVAKRLAPLPTGLMILSLTRLRSYALTSLPTKIREPFIEDLADLEDPMLGTRAKLRVVDRMWRCWGGVGLGIALN